MRYLILTSFLFFCFTGYSQFNIDLHINGFIPTGNYASTGFYNKKAGFAGPGIGTGVSFRFDGKNGLGLSMGVDFLYNGVSKSGKLEIDSLYNDVGLTNTDIDYTSYWNIPFYGAITYKRFLVHDTELLFEVGIVVNHMFMRDMRVSSDQLNVSTEYATDANAGYRFGFGFLFSKRMSFMLSFVDIFPHDVYIKNTGTYSNPNELFKGEIDLNYLCLSLGYGLFGAKKSSVYYY
jgi:hypothetical protein